MSTQKNKWDISLFPVITQAEFIDDPDAVLERIDRGEGPFIILEESGSKLVLIGWNDYWERFGALYPVGEKEKIEEACRRSKES